MVSPFLLESKRVLQYLCSQNIGWGELPEELQRTCHEAKLTMIQDIIMPRCFILLGLTSQRQPYIIL